MVSLFYARRYPAGREVNPRDQSVPNDTPVSDVNGPLSTSVNDLQSSDVPHADGASASSNGPNLTPTTTDVLPTPTIVPSPDASTPTGVPPQSSDVPNPSLQHNDPPPATTPVRNPPPESTSVPGQEPTKQYQHPPSSTPAPSPTPSPSHGQYVSTPTGGGPTPVNSDQPNPSTKEYGPVSSSPRPTQTDHFVPSSALNNPQPTTTQTFEIGTTPASSAIVSTPGLPASSTVPLSTSTFQPTPTAVLTQGKALSTDSSSNQKYIIGGAVGGGVLVLILLALLLFCCRKRRAKKDLERSGGDHSEGEHGYGQFACCNHGICNKNNGQPRMEQKSPLKPFILKSDPAALTPKEGRQQHTIPSKRRDSTESHKSAGSDTSSSYSSDSESSQHGRRRSQKRPPPLKLTSLVTPVINGPQNNPRHRVDRSSLQNPHEVPTIIVEPPQSATQTG